MSMNTYPMETGLAFHVDETVAAYLLRDYVLGDLRRRMPEPGTMLTPRQQVEQALREILSNDNKFKAEIQFDSAMYPALDEYGLFNITDCVDILQNEGDMQGLCLMSEFSGELQILDKDGHATGSSHTYDDDYVLLILPEREPSYFRQAYSSMQDFIDELKSKLGGLLPEDFDYTARIVSASGTYFC